MLILSTLIFGIDEIKHDDTIDISVYDTYYVIEKSFLIIPMTTLAFFGVYLIRMLGGNFKNITVNLIFMISNMALILIFTFLISLVNNLREIPSTTVYPPLSGGIVENSGNGWNYVYYSLLVIQFILIILLTISGLKTGMNYKRSE